MNNKGQSLVLFVLLLPLLMMIIALVFEMGRMQLIKNEYKSASHEAINYALKHLDDTDVLSRTKRLLEANVSGNSEVMIDNQKVEIHVYTTVPGVFTFLISDAYQVDLTYVGYISDGKFKIIEE